MMNYVSCCRLIGFKQGNIYAISLLQQFVKLECTFSFYFYNKPKWEILLAKVLHGQFLSYLDINYEISLKRIADSFRLNQILAHFCDNGGCIPGVGVYMHIWFCWCYMLKHTLSGMFLAKLVGFHCSFCMDCPSGHTCTLKNIGFNMAIEMVLYVYTIMALNVPWRTFPLKVLYSGKRLFRLLRCSSH